MAISTRQREGNLSYDVAVDNHLGGRLLISKRWKDHDSLSAYLKTTDIIEFINRWQERMKGKVLKYGAFNERDLMEE
ncbi:putative quinol monooxygenase [Pectobacterium atrosepticum]|uniref:putative quinol monooxygenase n=1 Tax=Pectobacterium atrosepticum TaxID=29471 RepID=UPI00049A0EE1|nr:hypothetical protein EV46_07485 [Pectobacterium atrosepticum]